MVPGELSFTVEFSGGAELLFNNEKTHQVSFSAEEWTIGKLLVWLKDNKLTERPELFMQGDTVRPGILVLVNDTDWELLEGAMMMMPRRPAKKADFYYFPPSAPCRMVMMTARVLNMEMNMKLVDLTKGEHLTPEFLQLNPQHTIPVLSYNGIVLSESRAIAAYLANSRQAGEKIYPKDPKKRAMVDQMLYFDMGKLYQRFLELYPPMLVGGAPFDMEKGKKLDEAVMMLEEYLARNKWAAGNQMTLADIAFVATVSTLEAVGYDFSKFPKITAWYANSKNMIPDYEKVNEGAGIWKQMMMKYKLDHKM